MLVGHQIDTRTPHPDTIADRSTDPIVYMYTFFFFSGTARRASARPYYDKTQRMPHAQSDRDVAHLAMLTARIKGRELDTGGGFLSHRMFNETQG